MNDAYFPVESLMAADGRFRWCRPLFKQARAVVQGANHGDLPRWNKALNDLPRVTPRLQFDRGLPVLGSAPESSSALRNTLMQFHPWRKGPIKVGGVYIDTEWRSDWKWQRVSPHIDLEGHNVLDIGCGNGYYGWRMLEKGARCVVGIDPTLVFVMQWLACAHFTGPAPNAVLPLGVEDLPRDAHGFDTVLSMGVLYHRKDPVSHLRRLRNLARPGGQVVIETLVLEDDAAGILVPEDRYARMRNVWAVPSIPVLQGWIAEAGLKNTELLDVSRTTTDEQRSTEWMSFESLEKCLDNENPELTVEGHPAPVRAVIVAKG